MWKLLVAPLAIGLVLSSTEASARRRGAPTLGLFIAGIGTIMAIEAEEARRAEAYARAKAKADARAERQRARAAAARAERRKERAPADVYEYGSKPTRGPLSTVDPETLRRLPGSESGSSAFGQ